MWKNNKASSERLNGPRINSSSSSDKQKEYVVAKISLIKFIISHILYIS